MAERSTTGTVGLTGGIGSGKSTVAEMFQSLGVPVISADRLAKELVAPESRYLQEIVDVFGEKVRLPDGRLDRAQLAQIVFSRPNRRKRLEAILHPPIRARMWSQVETLTDDYCILEIPLLFETGQWQSVDRVLLVRCDEQTQIKRLTTMRKLAAADAKKIMSAQLADAERIKHADDIIDNTGSLEDLHKNVERLHARYATAFHA